MLSFITWNFDPILFQLGNREIRWYGLCWALGFMLGFQLVQHMLKKTEFKQEWADTLFMYVLVGAILGARVGHCLFYDWAYFSQHPIEILYIWNGGLASHGGAIGLIVAVFLSSRLFIHKSVVWIGDHFVAGICVAGAFIRLGNLFNHEIYGNPTDLPWGFRFIDNLGAWMHRGAEPIYTLPCHPTQIYEIAYCVITLLVILHLFYRTDAIKREGLLTGVAVLGIFGARFLIEFIKLPQEAFEEGMFLNMGQLLSIPLILWGIFLIVRGYRKEIAKTD